MNWWYRTIRLGMEGSDVAVVQRKVGTLPTGVYDEETATRVKGVQKVTKILPNGEVDQDTADQLGETADLDPEWFNRDIQLWDEGEDVRHVRKRLGLAGNDDRFDPDAEAAVRRFQSEHQLSVNGRVDVFTAQALT